MLAYKDKYTNVVLQEYPWNSNPKIGWWRDNRELTLYHGTHIDNLLNIARTGLWAPSVGPTANWVSLALEPNTASGYASMSGGETNFRQAGSRARNVPQNERVVLVYKFPINYVLSNMNQHLRGNIDWTKNKLLNESEYREWKKTDQEYYMMTEIRMPKVVESKYLKGYMRKN